MLNRSEDVEIIRNGWVGESGSLGNGCVNSCNEDEVTCRDFVCWDEVPKGRISVDWSKMGIQRAYLASLIHMSSTKAFIMSSSSSGE